MKIIVLDGYTLNPGDLSWEAIEALGSCTVYDRTPPEKTRERAQDAEVVLTNKTVLDRATLDRLPALKYIGVLATGYNVVDIAAANEQGIVVSNIPSYGTESVAQCVFAHILHLTHDISGHGASVRAGQWAQSLDFSYCLTPPTELFERTLGVVGFGRIGRAVARIALGFGMKVQVHSVPEKSVDEGMTAVDLNTLLRESDVVSLHCPLTDDTCQMINESRLSLMKPTAWLINTSRGPLIDEAALAHALNDGRIAGAGLDVLSVEPPVQENPLLTARNCTVTPHIAWATHAARRRLMDTAIDNLKAFLAGRPQNCIEIG